MYQLLSRLLIYQNIPKDSVLKQLSHNIYLYEQGELTKEEVITGVYQNIHDLLDVATKYGFDENLWQNYLTYLLVSTQNPFSLTVEKSGAKEGSVNLLVKQDYEIFRQLFHYDFQPLEQELGIDCFSILTNYTAIKKSEGCYNKNVSDKVKLLSNKLSKSQNVDEFFALVTGFYQQYGVGDLGLNKAFRIAHNSEKLELIPITNTQEVQLSDIVGYELQKKKLVENTKAFLAGEKANNVLLFGDSGTGKSTSIKAILNEYYDDGLRMIEIYKHQFEDLSTVIAAIKNRNYKFIIYMDDLSFEEFEIEYKYLKAVIEGGLEIKPKNVLIYATSNRRHLIRETWSDRSDMQTDEMHHSDTMQEKLSLVARFGISIHFGKPDKKAFNQIVLEIAKRHPQIQLSEQELLLKANQWELSHGGMSGRCAEQFITYLLGQKSLED